MSLNHLEAIPVDTHIFQVAKKYLPHLSSKKTVTDKSYNEISEFFRNLYGPLAGWAQTVIFDFMNLACFIQKTLLLLTKMYYFLDFILFRLKEPEQK